MGRTAAMLVAGLVLTIGAGGMAGQHAHGERPDVPTDCGLSQADMDANVLLPFEDFDQAGTTRSTARQLGHRLCYAEAAAATRDYLLRAQGLTERQKNNLTFHLVQYLASSGKEAEAAWVIATAKRPDQPPDAPFDWNTYVEGTYAFLVRDRAGLEAATARLGAQEGEGNQINGRVLQGLLACRDQSYVAAYGTAECMPAAPAQP